MADNAHSLNADSSDESASSQLALSEKAVACYSRKDGWSEPIEPVEFLRDHPVFAHRFRQEQRAPFWAMPLTLPAILAAVILCTAGLLLGNWRVKNFVEQLFRPPPLPQATNLSEYPVALEERDIPLGIREAVERINQCLQSEQWSEAVAQANKLRSDSRDYALPKGHPRAVEWLFEILVAG